MSVGIDEFLSELTNLVRPNRFRISIGEEINLLAHTVSLPSKVVEFNESNNYRTGKNIKTPYAMDYEELVVTFYMSNNDNNKITEIEYFYNWLENGKGDSSSIFNSSENKYSINFLEDYAKDIHVEILDEKGNTLTRFIYTEAFPTSVNYSDLSFSSENELMEVTVNFYFEGIIKE